MIMFLIIDDDETFSYILARALKKQGHQAAIANDGDTALAMLRDNAVNYLSKPASVEEVLAAFEYDDRQASGVSSAHELIEDNPLSVQRVEWEYIQRQLVANDHNIAATARALGMHRRTLQRKLQKRPSQS